MARAAKVPKDYGDDDSGSCDLNIDLFVSAVLHEYREPRRWVRENEAIERGELIVKEAE